MSPDTAPSFMELTLRTIKACFEGLPLSLSLAFASLLLGLLLSVPLAVVHSKRRTFGAKLVRAYTYFFTGTPLLVQMYLIYNGVAETQWYGQLIAIPAFEFFKDAYPWVLLAFILNTTAYSTELFSGAIRNMDNGEVEAGRAYGMSMSQVMRHIILPSSLRRALPAYSNEVIMMIQATSLASLFTLVEIMGKAQEIQQETYRSFPVYVAAGLVYLGLTLAVVFAFKCLEKRYLTHLKPRAH